MTEKTVVRNAGEGQAFWMLGGLYELMVSSDESGGGVTIMQFTIPAGMGPPPHTHPGSETVNVLEGTLKYHVGDKAYDGGPGSTFHFPAGTLEWFEPTSQVKVLVTYAPGGIEKFFAEAGEPAKERKVPPPPSGPPDVERLSAIGAKHGMQVQAPPG